MVIVSYRKLPLRFVYSMTQEIRISMSTFHFNFNICINTVHCNMMVYSVWLNWPKKKLNNRMPKVTQKEKWNRNKVETLAQTLRFCLFPFTHCWYAIKTKWWFCIAVRTAIQNLFPRIWEIICATNSAGKVACVASVEL